MNNDFLMDTQESLKIYVKLVDLIVDGNQKRMSKKSLDT